ncbi:MAG TPA: tetratricopeptide repeat protein [Oculatellaceae cyanobacterium]
MVPANLRLTLASSLLIAAFLCCATVSAKARQQAAAPSTTATQSTSSARSHKHHSTLQSGSSTQHLNHQVAAGNHASTHSAVVRHWRHSSETVAAESSSHSGRSGHSHPGTRENKSKEETKQILVLVKDKHGRTHKVYRQIAVHEEAQEPSHKHTESRRVAVMLRDKHGHLHKVFRTETVTVADEGVRHSSAGLSRSAKGARESRKASKADNSDVSVAKHGRQTKPDDNEKNDEVTTAKDESGENKSADEPERLNPSYGKAYALYDEGANARISGNYPLAISCLGRALSMVPANSHGGPSVLQLNMEYELAQSAESKGDFSLAARYYARALADRPNFTEAAVRLCTVLARAGNYTDALKSARAAVQRSPNDPRTHAILAVILEKTGGVDEAKAEKLKTRSLMANIHSIDTAPLVSPDMVPPDTNPPAKSSEDKPDSSMSPGSSNDTDVP